MRIHLPIADSGNCKAFAIAASRIPDLSLAGAAEAADLIVTDNPRASFEGKPTLLVDAEPLLEEPWLFPSLPLRFSPDVVAVRESLDEGQLGRPGLLRLHLWDRRAQPSDYATRVGAVDLALWFFGNDPEAVHCLGNTDKANSCSIIHIGFPAGGMAVLDFAHSLPEGDGHRSFSLIGSKGAAYADDHRNRNLFFYGGSPQADRQSFELATIENLLRSFAEDVREGNDSGSMARSYRKASEIVTENFGEKDK